jgi:hypothetical protein
MPLGVAPPAPLYGYYLSVKAGYTELFPRKSAERFVKPPGCSLSVLDGRLKLIAARPIPRNCAHTNRSIHRRHTPLFLHFNNRQTARIAYWYLWQYIIILPFKFGNRLLYPRQILVEIIMKEYYSPPPPSHT